ncbi:MAG: hypothetical protein V3R90_05185 [Limibaculum sp.]
MTTEIENPFDLGEGVRGHKLHKSMKFRLGLLADAAAIQIADTHCAPGYSGALRVVVR